MAAAVRAAAQLGARRTLRAARGPWPVSSIFNLCGSAGFRDSHVICVFLMHFSLSYEIVVLRFGPAPNGSPFEQGRRPWPGRSRIALHWALGPVSSAEPGTTLARPPRHLGTIDALECRRPGIVTLTSLARRIPRTTQCVLLAVLRALLPPLRCVLKLSLQVKPYPETGQCVR